ncbi:MAG: tetratricopeptide repeat protein [Candidatus Dechloromonas phosphoritropha]
MKAHNYEAAKDLLARLHLASSGSQFILGHAFLKAESESMEMGDTFAKAVLVKTGDPCALARWADYLQARASTEKDPNIQEGMQKRANAGYAMAEIEGVHGFHFYNQWGGLLDQMGKYEEAIEKFDQARYFFGDDAWALLNIGVTLNRLGRGKEAEVRFKESLNKGHVPRAVDGYLNAIFIQKDYRRFLDAYEVWGLQLSGDQKERFSLTAGIAHCLLGERKEAEAALQNVSSADADAQTLSLRGDLSSCINNKPSASSVAPPSPPEATR